MLLTGKAKNKITIQTPKGIAYTADITDIKRSENEVSCAVIKDGGDAPDGLPAVYLAYVRLMQESFAELDAVLDDIDGMTEGELCDRYLVKSVF